MGASPKRRPVSTERPRVKPSTGRSRPIVCKRGTLLGPKESKTFIPAMLMNRPSAPPANAINTLSISNCRAIRALLAPRAVRTAISFCRDVALPIIKLATFAQAIRRTKQTAPNRIARAGRVFPTTFS